MPIRLWGFLLALVLSSPELALAQACCSAASIVAPGRLALHERALVGVRTELSGALGSFDSEDSFHSPPAGTSEVDLRSTPFLSARIVRRFQLGLSVPVVLSVRSAPSTGSETGGGLGDTTLSGRLDPILNGEHRWLPGIGVVFAFRAPTGRPPEAATTLLGSDVTGIGAWQGTLGLWLERSFGNWLVTTAGSLSLRTPRQVGEIHSQLAPQFSVLLAVGYSFSERLAGGLSGLYETEGDAQFNHESVAGTGKQRLVLGLAGSWEFIERWRLLLGASITPPTDHLGRNQIATAGGNLAVSWSFL